MPFPLYGSTGFKFLISAAIFESGKHMDGFVEENFKKKDGFRRSVELSEELDLYRQNYCGCEFSLAKSSENS